VVITIITILMALLAPALERAIYEGQLVVAARSSRPAPPSTVIDVMDRRRFYPNREGVREPRHDLWDSSMLRNGCTSTGYQRAQPGHGRYERRRPAAGRVG
jgi:hypothetical protein